MKRIRDAKAGSRFRGLLFVGLLVVSGACTQQHASIDSTVGSGPSLQNEVPQRLRRQGRHAFARGDLRRAYDAFDAAGEAFKDRGDRDGQCDCLVRSARVCLAMGHADKAAACLQTAEPIALTLDNQELLGRVYAARGNLQHIAGDPESAESSLKKAIAHAEKCGSPELLASAYNDLGNLFGSLQQYPKALKAYRRSASLAMQNGRLLRAAIALTNGAKVTIAYGDGFMEARKARPRQPESMIGTATDSLPASAQNRKEPPRRAGTTRATILMTDRPQPKERVLDPSKAMDLFTRASALLDEARAILPDAPHSQSETTTRINLGLAYMELARRISENAPGYLASAGLLLFRAVESAREFQDARLVSYAKGSLGGLRQQEGRLAQADRLTAEAIYWAQQADAPESLYRWQWQHARILTALHRLDEALAAYRAATLTLESVRGEFPNCYGLPRAELRRAANDLYSMYVDVLLQRAACSAPDRQQQWLKTARETVEKRKVFELREYFHDDCLGDAAMGATAVDALIENTVVIYPILLPDRLEIIAAYPAASGPEQDHDRQSGSAAGLRHYVTRVDARAVAAAADNLRASLADKASQGYLLHAKKLYDWIIRPLAQDLAQCRPDTLVFVPDGPLRNIPLGALHDGSAFLIQNYAVAVTPGLVLADPTPWHPEQTKVLAAGLASPSRGFEALPGVSREIQAIAALHPTKVLMDEQFSLENFEKALENDPYNVVHIASHGKFSETAEGSFLLAADQHLTFNDLSRFVGLYRFRTQPLELLTLSACETAAGNDQAALGLAGIAVKIGARSALATLWAVDDQAAALLVAEFYRQLGQPGVSRAAALKLAKQKLLGDPVYGHPGYWSPFILINNWL
jgi:CHAT domain-containing protein/tetratricopeptide (TPR) repeat protein